MYCEQCGTKLPSDAAFCTNCGIPIKGANVNGVKEKIVDNDVQLNVKPTFKFGYLAAPYLIVFLVICLMFSPMLLIPETIGIFILLAIFFLAAIILIMTISLLIIQKQYNAYNYNFYKTKVIYSDSFINISEKEVKYKYIREVSLRRGLFQRWFNIGTITLYTNAETGYGNGINIQSVENAETVYKEIKELIDND